MGTCQHACTHNTYRHESHKAKRMVRWAEYLGGGEVGNEMNGHRANVQLTFSPDALPERFGVFCLLSVVVIVYVYVASVSHQPVSFP